MAQLFRPWKCLSSRRCRPGTNASPQPRHRYTDVLHWITFRLIPPGVKTRSKALFILGLGQPTFSPLGTTTSSLLLQEGHLEAVIVTAFVTRSLWLWRPFPPFARFFRNVGLVRTNTLSLW